MIFIFHILYQADLSFILLVFLLILPAVLFIILIIQSLSLKIYVSCTERSAERGKPEVIKVTLENRSIFPITVCRLNFRCKSFSQPDKPIQEKYSAAVPVSPLSKESVALKFTPSHCGYMDISAERAMIGDILGLTFLFRKLRFSDRIAVLPTIYPFGYELESEPSSGYDGDSLSESNSGDDPSEIFELREYRIGDGMNRIHWKLSTRGEELIVKELSLSISSRILIICDLGACKNSSEADMLLDITASLSSFLAGRRAAHTIAAASEGGSLIVSEVSDQESLASALTELCCGNIVSGSRITDDEYHMNAAELFRRGASRIIAVSPNDDKAFISELLKLSGEQRLTVLCSSRSENVSDSSGNDKELLSAEIIYSSAEELEEKFREFYSGSDK